MLYLSEEARKFSESYSGAGSNGILEKLFLFLRTGHYNRFYNEKHPLDWEEGENKNSCG